MGVRETRGKEREETATPGFSAIFSMAGLDCVIDKESGAKSALFVRKRVQRWEKECYGRVAPHVAYVWLHSVYA